MNIRELLQKDFNNNIYNYKPYVTYSIILINILVFIIMTLFGADFLYPSVKGLIVWGANFGPNTYNGEQWRVLTSVFLHIGIIHLILNMYVLYSIGILLEGIFGSYVFLISYLLNGIGGSIGSLFWDSYVVSAGASGAIFGLFGWFFALLSTNFFDRAYKEYYFKKAGILLLINFGFGFATGWVDNAGHIGGLFTGITMGYFIYYAVAQKAIKNLRFFISILLLIVYGGSFLYAYDYLNKGILIYNNAIKKFKILEENIITEAKKVNSSNKKEAVNTLNKIDILIDSSIFILKEANGKRIPKQLSDYISLNIKSFELLEKNYFFYKKGIEEETDAYYFEVLRLNKSIDSLHKLYGENDK